MPGVTRPAASTSSPSTSAPVSQNASTSTSSSSSTSQQSMSSQAPLSSDPSAETSAAGEVCEPGEAQFESAVVAGDCPGAMSAWDRTSPVNRPALSASATPTVACWEMLDALALLGHMGVDTFTAFQDHHPAHLLELARQSNPVLVDMIGRHPRGYLWFREQLQPDEFALLLQSLNISAYDRVATTGLFEGAPQWRLFLLVLDTLPHADRQPALEEVRAQGKWDELIQNVSADQLPILQRWLGEEMGDGTNQSLADRIAAATNSDRGRRALAAVDAVNDPTRRITPRLRELLALGVALPALEGNDLAREGILSINSATRAAQALVGMPAQEYTRLLLLLETTGDASRLQQQFLLLESLASRHDQMVAPAGTGNLQELEGFADSIRNMNRDDLVRQTSPTATQSGTAGLQQKYTDSCGITSIQIVRANADPVEALRMHENNELGQNASNNQTATEQQSVLAGSMGGQSTLLRSDHDAVVACMQQATAAGCSATERQALVSYLTGQATFNLGLAMSGYAKLVLFPAANTPPFTAFTAFRNYSTSQNGTGVGMLFTEMAPAANTPQTVEGATGRTAAADTPGTIWAHYTTTDTNADGNANEVNGTTQPARQAWIVAMLGRAETLVDQGNDVVFNVQWDGGGGHYMTFVNVRTDGGRQFQVHDPWTGLTYWLTDAQLVAGTNFQGHTSAGCMMGLMS